MLFIISLIGKFNFSFYIDYNQLTINEANDTFELKINN